MFSKGKGGRYTLDKDGGSYLLNGKGVAAPGKYFPDIAHEFVVDFITRHKEEPFFVFYPMPHVHGPILPTPESKPGADAKQLYTDNIVYMDKLVGRLMSDLDKLGLRKKTVVLFTGDNGTALLGVDSGSAINGRMVSGHKGSMLEGGSRVPLIVSCPGTTPAGRTIPDLVDFSDFFVTFAALAGASLPAGVELDGKSFAAQIKGEKGTPRDWVYVELNGNSYVRNDRYKLTNAGNLFDLADAPFVEKEIPKESDDETSKLARAELQKVLDTHVAGGPEKITGRKADKKLRKQEKRERRDGPETSPAVPSVPPVSGSSGT
jgi:arylsulfatase A-like enzyme